MTWSPARDVADAVSVYGIIHLLCKINHLVDNNQLLHETLLYDANGLSGISGLIKYFDLVGKLKKCRYYFQLTIRCSTVFTRMTFKEDNKVNE